jgi:DNA-directed RNA polymerase specialized sigma24 family protein
MMLAALSQGDLTMAADLFSSEATVQLLDRYRRGDASALDRLLERCLPPLQRWAHDRLPQSLRGAQETADLVNSAVETTIPQLASFDCPHQGALQAHLRQAVLDRLRDLGSQDRQWPPRGRLTNQIAAEDASPLELAIGAENVERYERAFARLAPADRAAIMGRMELQYEYEDLAVALGKPDAQSARTAVMDALKRLSEEMGRG